jgi:uncharacterized protein (DUF488 family)
MELFTIGHSNHSIEAFLEMLHLHGVTALVDVRSHPYNRYLKHFCQKPLKAVLNKADIHYVFLGKELGARPNDATCYVDSKAIYENIAATTIFAEGIQRILNGAKTYKLALMCAEKDPITCHRTILICPFLQTNGVKIDHILPNGELESHPQLEERLLDLQGLNLSSADSVHQLALLSDLSLQTPIWDLPRKDRLKAAYRKQGSAIAYIEKKDSADDSPTD